MPINKLLTTPTYLQGDSAADTSQAAQIINRQQPWQHNGRLTELVCCCSSPLAGGNLQVYLPGEPEQNSTFMTWYIHLQWPQ